MNRLVLLVLTTFIFSGCSVGQLQSADLKPASMDAPPQYADLLQKYVTSSGVRYADWHQNPEDMKKIQEVVDFYATTLPPKERQASLAWHLNAYNAWILHNILAKYPTKGPLDGEMFFFHGNRITISGQKTSFNDLEQKAIRPVFKEPRVHFALNCASASCPPLNPHPFASGNLDAQLDELTRAFVNGNPHAIQIQDEGKTVLLSKIFDWYKDDFQSAGGVIPFINKYRESKLASDANIRFMDYNWSLNEAK